MKKDLTLTKVHRERSEDDIHQKPLEFKLIWRLFSYTKPHARKRNWLIFMVVLRSLQLPMLTWMISRIINGPITAHDSEAVMQWVMWFFALSLFTQWSFHYRQRWGLELGEAVIQDLRQELYTKLVRMPMSFYNRIKVGSVISRFASDAEAVRVGVQDVFFVTTVQAGQMLVAAILMLWYDWVLFLVVLAMAPVLVVFNYKFRQSLSRGNRAVQESWSRVTAALAESVTGIKVTQGFVRQEINSGLFADLIDDHSKLNLGVQRTTGVMLPMLELNGQVFNAALLIVGGYRVLNPDIHIPFGSLFYFFFLAGLFFSAIQPIAAQYSSALTAMAGAERVFRMLDMQPDWQEPPTVTDLEVIRGKVEFENVSFDYGNGRSALNEVSFSVEPGQTVALVGHTGSGKSSIINLITKFYLPTKGTVSIDGRDILQVKGDSIHRQMGIVSQQNFLFTGTVLDNIRVGRPGATDEEVIEVVRQLDFLDFIATLTAGFATQVGERGASISLGQRQLICFARAMLAQPRILILDEATSSIDAMTEARIQQALEKLLKGRTSFVVAHRLSTIRNADLLLVLDHGRIIERGTHDSLLAAKGKYASMHDQFVTMTD